MRSPARTSLELHEVRKSSVMAYQLSISAEYVCSAGKPPEPDATSPNGKLMLRSPLSEVISRCTSATAKLWLKRAFNYSMKVAYSKLRVCNLKTARPQSAAGPARYLFVPLNGQFLVWYVCSGRNIRLAHFMLDPHPRPAGSSHDRRTIAGTIVPSYVFNSRARPVGKSRYVPMCSVYCAVCT